MGEVRLLLSCLPALPPFLCFLVALYSGLDSSFCSAFLRSVAASLHLSESRIRQAFSLHREPHRDVSGIGQHRPKDDWIVKSSRICSIPSNSSLDQLGASASDSMDSSSKTQVPHRHVPLRRICTVSAQTPLSSIRCTKVARGGAAT